MFRGTVFAIALRIKESTMVYDNVDLSKPHPSGGAPPSLSRAAAKHQAQFMVEVRTALHHVCRSIKAFENGCLPPREAGFAYQPATFLHQLAEDNDYNALSAACEILLMQVMNLFQSRFDARTALTSAILEQAAVVELEASRAVGGGWAN